jgi:hypothetical protein
MSEAKENPKLVYKPATVDLVPGVPAMQFDYIIGKTCKKTDLRFIICFNGDTSICLMLCSRDVRVLCLQSAVRTYQ